MTSTLKGGGSGGSKAKMGCYRTYGGGGLASVLDVQFSFFFFFFFVKKNWICAMTRHHAEPNTNILLTRDLPFESVSDSGAIL